MSLLSGGEGIRSEGFSVFVPSSFPVWDAVLFSYVRKGNLCALISVAFSVLER